MRLTEMDEPGGTILSCSDCGEGLYKVTVRATTADLVMISQSYRTISDLQ